MINVSVLMSIYHKEKPKYFQEAMESIIHQTKQPSEILLVKDGLLTDKLDEMIDMYKEKLGEQFVIIQLQENQGLGKALAEGVKLCKNQLIARMDTDDIMLPNRLEIQYEQFEKKPELTIIGSNIVEFYDNIDNVLSKRIVPETSEEIRNFSKRRNPFNHMTVMFKKDDVLSVGNYLPLQGFEDYYLWVRLLKKNFLGENSQNILVYARTGKEMYMRRGGIRYLFPGLKARKIIYKEGLGTYSDYLFVSLVHIVTCVMPNRLRSHFYEKMLRK